MKRVVLCADDYALAPGVSQAIRHLVAARRINATSVMTVFDDLDAEARALNDTDGHGASIGLHLTLTGGYAPLAAGTGTPRLPSLSRLVIAAVARRLDLVAVQAEVEAQFSAFRRAFGRPPDHVDGHQHVHVLPGIRAIVLAATRRHAPRAWVRDVTPAGAALSGLDPKGRIIGALGHGLARDAGRLGLATNRGFAGAYDFSAGHDFARLLKHFLAGVPDGAAVMVHPGHVDDPLTARDPVTRQRELEFAVLDGPQLPAILAATGVRLS